MLLFSLAMHARLAHRHLPELERKRKDPHEIYLGSGTLDSYIRLLF
jgi:hypothetical protein